MTIDPATFPPCPFGRSDCRLSFGSLGYSTLLAWEPEYVRSGNRVNRNPNTYTGTCSCRACGTEWTYTDRDGEPRKYNEPVAAYGREHRA